MTYEEYAAYYWGRIVAAEGRISALKAELKRERYMLKMMRVFRRRARDRTLHGRPARTRGRAR